MLSSDIDISKSEFESKTFKYEPENSMPAVSVTGIRTSKPTTTSRSRGALSMLSRIRNALREPMAEFLAVAIFVIFGAGADAQVGVSADTRVVASRKGEYISTNFGWGIGLAMAVWISGGISGGHVNPSITLALAARRRFPWRKVPMYILAQTMGALVGAALVYAQYARAIDIVEGGRGVRTLATAGFFSSFALDYMSSASCFFSEFLGTAVLAFTIIATTDKKNSAAPPRGLLPLVLFLTLLGLGAALGMQTGSILGAQAAAALYDITLQEWEYDLSGGDGVGRYASGPGASLPAPVSAAVIVARGLRRTVTNKSHPATKFISVVRGTADSIRGGLEVMTLEAVVEQLKRRT
ncbi:Aquaglycerol porin AQY3 [Psilocybe cubensis]|uniref:Aquaglycerol porin AQY3 n=1 Tax=Psilocybe cubensis TaxID=181762 RepID=A0ACB8GGX3_PSICU|nr:Aquaglycerol porin AQY3 [Psilocybe cubensis]KAH9474747.1 Aquaglycerol porin AQY3 [Psilocybe cubensis]